MKCACCGLAVHQGKQQHVRRQPGQDTNEMTIETLAKTQPTMEQ